MKLHSGQPKELRYVSPLLQINFQEKYYFHIRKLFEIKNVTYSNIKRSPYAAVFLNYGTKIFSPILIRVIISATLWQPIPLASVFFYT